MLGLGRNRTERSDTAVAATRIDADLAGAVISGQVAIGEHIVQIHAEHGAIVNYRPAVERAEPRARPTPVRLLPRAFDALVGREGLLSEAHAALAAGGPVELVGEPGVGKTSLLRNLTHHLAELRPHGVVYTGARDLPLSDVLQFLFESFYDCGGQVVVATSEELSRYLADRRALIAVDDAELGREQLQQVADVVPNSTFLWASAGRGLWGEGRSFDVNGLDDAAAATLLRRELGRPLASAEERPLLNLCRALGGSPLRILQLAALLRARVAIGAEITTESVELARAGLDRLLAAELSDADRRVISPLAAVDAPVPTDAIAAATGMSDAAEQLARLEAGHITESHSPRYTLAGDPTASLISSSGEADAAEPADRGYAELIGLFAGDDAGAAAAQFGEAEFVLALVREAERRGSVEDVLSLAHAGDRAFALSGRWGAWGVALDSALRLATNGGLTSDESWARHQLGSRALGLGDRKAAVRQLSRALELREALGDRAGAAVTRHNLDLLSGPPPPDRPPRAPRPWLPLVAAVLIVVALFVGVAIAVAGGGQSPTTGSSGSSNAVQSPSNTGQPPSNTGQPPSNTGQPPSNTGPTGPGAGEQPPSGTSGLGDVQVIGGSTGGGKTPSGPG